MLKSVPDRTLYYQEPLQLIDCFLGSSNLVVGGLEGTWVFRVSL